jgi:hypothetical protein
MSIPRIRITMSIHHVRLTTSIRRIRITMSDTGNARHSWVI